MQQINHKLVRIRELMGQKSLQALLVPHNDAHDSEYISDSDERLAYISGFTGSAGIGLITNEIAYLWTDSRYFIQAQKQLELGWELKKLEKGTPIWTDYATTHLKGMTIGFDPALLNAATALSRTKSLKAADVTLLPVEGNLVDLAWEGKRPPQTKQIIIHKNEFVQNDAKSKIQQVFKYLESKNEQAKALLISKLDQIAWVLNLRGFDIEFNPLFKSYLYLERNGGTLYVDNKKVSEEVRKYLSDLNIELKEYNQVFDEQFPKVLITNSEINFKLYSILAESDNINLNPIEYLKAIKNPRECLGFRQCHIRDGAALVNFAAWLEQQLLSGVKVNEYEATVVLEEFRRKQPLNMGLSFATISSSGANAAIVHYKPEADDCANIDPKEVYLLDSGGQYLDGTTDVTRTFHFTTSTAEQRNAYTRVLLGNLDLERMQYPANSNIHGGDLDALARRWLWADKLDYGHGTGHGVGYFLNVHEGPHGISKYRTQPLELGMIVSNEPGYYKEGSFGIRIENLIIVVDKGDQYWGFENLTMCPYDRNLIDMSLLSPKDVDYINAYHKQVRELVLPLLTDEVAKKWLIKNSEPLK